LEIYDLAVHTFTEQSELHWVYKKMPLSKMFSGFYRTVLKLQHFGASEAIEGGKF